MVLYEIFSLLNDNYTVNTAAWQRPERAAAPEPLIGTGMVQQRSGQRRAPPGAGDAPAAPVGCPSQIPEGRVPGKARFWSRTGRICVPGPLQVCACSAVRGHHSHSMVPGGFEVMSYTTRFTLRTPLQMREATSCRNLDSNGYLQCHGGL